ncbi:MAG: carcinine hydrolase/isopenicillin-N N-acyltransferase family protein [Planctomycetota bacterium]|nr:carcinine hydrolase/isopenicillin-N N-acyltransferase family protein [Planctomycetota bacterium]
MSTRLNTPQINAVCTGSITERGHVHGEAMAETIRESAEAIHQLEAFRLQSPWWLPYRAFVRLADWKAERALRTGLSAELPEAWVRLVAMSKSSGVSVRRLALLNALEPVLSDLSACVTGLEAGCSAVAVGSDRSGGHGPIIAHNFDYLPLVQRFYCIRDERPEFGFRSLQFSLAPMAGLVDGINETGLAVTFNYAYATDKHRPAPTI